MTNATPLPTVSAEDIPDCPAWCTHPDFAAHDIEVELGRELPFIDHSMELELPAELEPLVMVVVFRSDTFTARGMRQGGTEIQVWPTDLDGALHLDPAGTSLLVQALERARTVAELDGAGF